MCVFLNMCAHTLVIEHFLYMNEIGCHELCLKCTFTFHIQLVNHSHFEFIYAHFEFILGLNFASHIVLYILCIYTQSMRTRRITGQYQLKFENYSKWIRNVPFCLRKFWNLGVWILKLIKIRREKKYPFRLGHKNKL
jgi:hypothetical protein